MRDLEMKKLLEYKPEFPIKVIKATDKELLNYIPPKNLFHLYSKL